jgi:hypothetical protein
MPKKKKQLSKVDINLNNYTVYIGHNLHGYGAFDSSESPSTSDSDGYVSGPNDELETNVSKFA